MRGIGSYRMLPITKLTPCRHSHSSRSTPRSRLPFRQCVPFFLSRPSTFALRSPRSSFCGSGRGNQRKRRVAFTGNGDDDGLPIWRQRWRCYRDSEKCRERGSRGGRQRRWIISVFRCQQETEAGGKGMPPASATKSNPGEVLRPDLSAMLPT